MRRYVDQRPRVCKPKNTIHCIDGNASSRGYTVRCPVNEETLAIARIAGQEESDIFGVHHNRDMPRSMTRRRHDQNIACLRDLVALLKWTEILGSKGYRLWAKPLRPPVRQVTPQPPSKATR